MKNLKELIKEYADKKFTFKHLYKNEVVYEKKYKSKTVILHAEIDARSDLDLYETVSSLDSETIITDIYLK